MRKFIGIFCVALGVLCILSAVAIAVYNSIDASRAGEASQVLLQNLDSATKQESLEQEPAHVIDNKALPHEMLTAKVDGYDCVGVLSVPVLELELPVLDDWDYEKLRVAPCRYFGNCSEPDFVIAAHNYDSHFGRLSLLQAGDLILFTDISDNIHCYEVVLLETLPGTATEAMISSGFDLSLYTCTPGGASRVTVRCNLVT